MDEFLKRRVVVIIENDQIGGGLFAPIVAATLHELADMIDRDNAGRNEREVYRREDGTVAWIASEDATGVCIPYRETGRTCLVAEYVPDIGRRL